LRKHQVQTTARIEGLDRGRVGVLKLLILEVGIVEAAEERDLRWLRRE
jgi:hypothetical protein